MATGILRAATLAAVLALATEASARAPAPLIPTALVEDVKSGTAAVEFMDYVGTGQVIKLEPRDVLVLSYLKSCQHETITGGTVLIGADHSDVQGGKLVSTKVACDGGKIRLTSQQANASGASAFRLQSSPVEPVLYALPPMVQIPKNLATADRTLVIERVGRPGDRHEIKLGDDVAPGSFLDLAKVDTKPFTRGAIYNASLGADKVMFMVHAKAKTASKTKSGKAPVISRLLRFPAG
jgi:hypothetical protein